MLFLGLFYTKIKLIALTRKGSELSTAVFTGCTKPHAPFGQVFPIPTPALLMNYLLDDQLEAVVTHGGHRTHQNWSGPLRNKNTCLCINMTDLSELKKKKKVSINMIVLHVAVWPLVMRNDRSHLEVIWFQIHLKWEIIRLNCVKWFNAKKIQVSSETNFVALQSVHHCIPKNFQIIKTEKVTFLRRAASQQGQGERWCHILY